MSDQADLVLTPQTVGSTRAAGGPSEEAPQVVLGAQQGLHSWSVGQGADECEWPECAESTARRALQDCEDFSRTLPAGP